MIFFKFLLYVAFHLFLVPILWEVKFLQNYETYCLLDFFSYINYYRLLKYKTRKIKTMQKIYYFLGNQFFKILYIFS